MGHVDGVELADTPDAVAWTAAMARLAEVQRVLSEDPAVLTIAGVPMGRLDELIDAIPALLEDDDLLLIEQPGGLTRAEADAVRSRRPMLIDAVARLLADGIPPSLDHGDLTPHQVIVGEMGPVILDWSDASITHPFLAAASFLMEPSGQPAVTESALAEAYLGPWASGRTDDSLRRTLELARIVHPLQMTRLYSERILPGLEQPWEVERTVPRLLRSLLGRPAILPG